MKPPSRMPIPHRRMHPVDSAVLFVAAQPGGPDRLLAHHRSGIDGRTCRGCAERWPCSLATIARRAAQVEL